jgi:hypothetical protein
MSSYSGGVWESGASLLSFRLPSSVWLWCFAETCAGISVEYKDLANPEDISRFKHVTMEAKIMKCYTGRDDCHFNWILLNAV